jgi:hypothetical protein
MNIKDIYHIEPTDIQMLIDVCESFDKACQDCVDNRDNPDYEITHEFGFNFECLKTFAKANPNFDYQKLLPNHINTISYFFSNSLVNAEQKAMEDYKRRMKHYNSLY